MGRKKNNAIPDEEDICVTLDMEDGTQEECEILTIFEVNGNDYIALLPEEELDAEEATVYLYRYLEDADGNPSLENISSDAEYDAVAERFDEWLEEAEATED